MAAEAMEKCREKAVLVADIRNVYKPLGDHAAPRDQDFGMMRRFLLQGCEELGSFAFDALMIKNGRELDGRFHDKLEAEGYQLTLEESPTSGGKQGFIDIVISNSLLLDLIPRHNPERVILVSGDSDYFDTVRRILAQGIKVTVAAFRGCMGPYDKLAVDRVYLDSIPMIRMSAPEFGSMEVVE